jgi:hypothetical protein
VKLSDLQRCRVVDEAGERIGHLFDVACELRAHDEPPVVTTLLVGRAGLARRLGSAAGGPKRCRPAMSSRFATARSSSDGGIDCA